MRGFIVLITALLVLAGTAFALWRFEVVEVPFLPNPETVTLGAPSQDLFALAKTDDVGALTQKIAAGANLDARDKFGQTPLMYAASESDSPEVVAALLNAGAELNAQTKTGWTALMYAARDAADLRVPLLLLNAGADPTLTNDEGQSAADVARDNIAMSTSLFGRLQDLAGQSFEPNWPSGYTVPVEGATISSRASHLPGAPRAYRNGTHEGFDFYSGSVSVSIEYGTPIHAVAGGRVIRADHDYAENSPEQYDQVIEAAKRSLNTPPDILDALRGRQVWILHAGGFVSRYAHLSGIPEEIVEGASVAQGDVIGMTGNSGTLEAAQGTQDGPHPHVEIWQGEESYLGKNLGPTQIYTLAEQLFGEDALPPYTGE